MSKNSFSIALIQTPCYELNNDRLEPSLGLLYLATWLNQHGYQTQIVDLSSISNEIRFASGEPMEHSDFRKILEFAKSLGFFISLGTNGVYTKEKRAWICESGVDWFIVSLDGTEAINDRVRGRGTNSQVLQTLDDFSRHPHLRVRVNMVIARHNIEAILVLARLADQLNVANLNMIPPCCFATLLPTDQSKPI